MELLHSVKSKIGRFTTLSNIEKWSFIKYSFFYNLYLLLFRTAGYKKARNLVEYIISRRTGSNKDKSLSEADNLSKIINLALGNTLFNSTCLEKSLFTYFILGINGIKSELKIGVENSENRFSAHAWVEKEGIVLNGQDNPLEKYSAF